jgi:hypothetical protein
MDNAGYYHYFFARILNYLNDGVEDFSSLLRNRKHNSLILFRIFNDDDRTKTIEDISWDLNINAVSGFCLVRRYDLEKISSYKHPLPRIKYLIKQGYLPEMSGFELEEGGIIDFIAQRDHRIRKLVEKIWSF